LTREQLRVGVAGCGTIARQVHLPLLQRRRDVKLVAVADSDGDALAEAVLRYRGAQPYRSTADMLSEAELDAVVVTLPPALHSSAARAVFEAGRHLYLEKPMALTLDDGAAIMSAWRRSGRVGVMGFNCRANPLHLRLRQLMRAGRAGTVVYLQTFLASAARSLPDWKRQRASGGGVLLDLGVHHIDLIRFLTGCEITGVRASVSSRTSEQDTALLELQLEGGIGAHAFFSLAAAEGDHVEVHGDVARLAVARYTSLDVHITDNPGRGFGVVGRVLRRAGAVRYLARAVEARRSPLREPGYAVLLDRFIRAGLTGVAPLDVPDIADGFAATAVVAAAELSLATGQMETPTAFSEFPELLLQVTP
jgi:myo-inositol 2-dehydrogenase / D-chiro-inositol 1-dehydrogenase